MCPTAGAPTTITQVTADVSAKCWALLTWGTDSFGEDFVTV